jgi:hypothetical protein
MSMTPEGSVIDEIQFGDHVITSNKVMRLSDVGLGVISGFDLMEGRIMIPYNEYRMSYEHDIYCFARVKMKQSSKSSIT